ncbi:helix-turn-helix domain-containing protein [Streptomyces cylindrosporus]|uniref:Helix-turn-helix transcriptional regulator n=1 Tax=Streptomyces cylindrosporus TaxID=2927583 RepID=A0ABS9XXS5_9ACTN|nr:helix-turn-helix transcriptional regulator [Streptomyces cylindrosporus]MCI3269758.1 helix-turn-helix transcriptional regulator [Streptomyces cylindrosporus]
MSAPGAPSAALQRLRLRTELRKARIKAGLTQREVAQKMEWSPSKLIRIEAGEVGISVNDLRPLLTTYDITDRRKIETLLDLARGSRKMPFTEFRDIYSKEFLQYLALESSASIIRNFNPLVVPGLLQTEEYARAVMSSYSQGMSEELMDRYIEGRLARQDLLQGDEGSQLFFVIDESVVRRQVGGRGVMRTQLERLAELAAGPRVSIQILPFSVGAHPGMQGPFTLFEFEAEEMPDSIYLENPRGDSYLSNSPEETGRYLESFWELEDAAVKDDVDTLLLRLAGRLGEGRDDLVSLLAETE